MAKVLIKKIHYKLFINSIEMSNKKQKNFITKSANKITGQKKNLS